MDYRQLHSALTANIYAQKIAHRDYEKAQAEADEWEKRYQNLLKEGREDLVQDAKFYKDIYAKKAANLKAMLDEQTQILATLKCNLPTQSETLTNRLSNASGLKSSEAKFKQIKTPSQAMTDLPGSDLETRLCKLEREIEAVKAQLLNQQAAIGKCLKQNATALEDVRTLLAKTSSHGTVEPVSTNLPTALAILESDTSLDDELAALKAQLLCTATLENPAQPLTADISNQTIDADGVKKEE